MRIFCPAIVARSSSLLIDAYCCGSSSRTATAGRSTPAAGGGQVERVSADGSGRGWWVPAASAALLLEDLGDPAGADGAATLPDRELQALLHGDRLDQLDQHLGGVPRHDHLGALGQGH